MGGGAEFGCDETVAASFEPGTEAGWVESCAAIGKKARWLGFFSHQLTWHPPSREAGTTSASPSARVAGAAGWLLSIITSHAAEDGCTRCAPAIADGCNGCAPAILPKMAAI